MLPAYTKILYATDLSPAALSALKHAASLADRYNADVTVLHILPDSLELLSEGAGADLAELFGEEAAHFINKGDVERAMQAMHVRLESLLKEDFTHPQTGAHLANARAKVVCGEAAERILEESRSGGYDLIVMGTHGHGVLLDMVIGSVAKETIRRSRIPVLVVPLPRASQ
jgi:nucleotide-binding universal stress UspA family protein